MRYQVLSRPLLAIRTPARWRSAWQWVRHTGWLVLAELALYACGSHRSRLHGKAALRELDAHLRRDIGLPARALDAAPPNSFEGYR